MLRNAVILASAQLIWHLTWQAQLVAWPVSVVLVVWLAIWGRSRADAEAVPVPAAGELRAVENEEPGAAHVIGRGPV